MPIGFIFRACYHSYIHLPWAKLKSALSNFLSELLRLDIKIVNIPESENNRDTAEDKANKVNILCENDTGELLLIELQYYSEWDFCTGCFLAPQS